MEPASSEGLPQDQTSPISLATPDITPWLFEYGDDRPSLSYSKPSILSSLKGFFKAALPVSLSKRIQRSSTFANHPILIGTSYHTTTTHKLSAPPPSPDLLTQKTRKFLRTISIPSLLSSSVEESTSLSPETSLQRILVNDVVERSALGSQFQIQAFQRATVSDSVSLISQASSDIKTHSTPGPLITGLTSPEIRAVETIPVRKGVKTISWSTPDSWNSVGTAVSDPTQFGTDKENHTFYMPIDENPSRAQGLGSTSGKEGQPYSSSPDRSEPKYKLRVYRSNGTYNVVSLDLDTSVAQLQTALHKGFSVHRELHRLYLQECNRERLLAPSEMPAPILQRRLELAGYNEKDGLQIVGASDIQFLLKFIFKSERLGGEEEQDIIYDSFEFVNLAGKSLRTVPIMLYRYSQTIVTLDLSKNPLLEIPRDFIESCTQLRELRMVNMTMTKVPQSVRHGITLHRLDLSCNRIVDLEDAGLDCLHGLLSLKIQNNRLTQLPSRFADLNLLRFLNISNNQLLVLPSVVYSLTSLVDLDISFNMISYLSPNLDALVNLEKLILFGNKMRTFPEEITGLVSLTELDCRRNSLADISVISRVSSLQILRADHNCIRTLDLSLGPGIKELEISNNDVTALNIRSSSITMRPLFLTYLDISHSNLISLDDFAIGTLKSLSTLKMDHNQLKNIPEAICNLSGLVHLSCSNNFLETLPGAIGNLLKLNFLDSHRNKLINIPQSLWLCGALQSINLTSNRIRFWHYLPEYDTPLQRRGGGQNHQHSSGMDVMSLSSVPPLALSLQTLCLGDNGLQEDIFHTLKLLQELSVINLSSNSIREIPTSFLRTPSSLQEIYLSSNNLMTLPSEDLHRFKELKVLFLNGNKLQSLPTELGKVWNLNALDVGSNLLKYNVNNWEFEWNWNFNPRLQYLNFSGNKRLEIKPDRLSARTGSGSEPTGTQIMLQKQLTAFSNLNELHVLGLMDVTTMFMQSIPEESQNLRIRTSLSELNGMGYGIADMLGKLPSPNIFDLAIPLFRETRDECLVGMFGQARPPSRNTARLALFLRDTFPAAFTAALDALDPNKDERIADAMRRAFLNVNQKLFEYLAFYDGTSRKGSNSSTDSVLVGDIHRLKAGASAVVIYVVGKTLYVANVGNFQAVISRKGIASVVSIKHNPFDPGEMARIRLAEGWVSPDGMVNDAAFSSRSFGYFHLQPAVNSRPYICEWRLSHGDEFIIIASNNLWDYISYQLAVDITCACNEGPMRAAERLRDLAFGYGAEGNIMVMVLNIGDTLGPDETNSQLNKGEIKGEEPSSNPQESSLYCSLHSKTSLTLQKTPEVAKNATSAFDLRGKTMSFSNEEIKLRRPKRILRPDGFEGICNLSSFIKISTRPLRAGGFCDIYSGDLINESNEPEPVALKMLRLFNTEREEHLARAKKMFRKEVSLWCRLQHPYVLPFYGTCEMDESRLFMVSPWAAGGNSLQFLRQNPATDRCRLLWQTSSALAYLHSGLDIPPIVHGDLKADNVLVSSTGDALLCDFGLSRYVEDILSKSGSSSAGRGGGHARFMAPERLVPPKDAPYGSRATTHSDVFAFASLMLQIYTEDVPFGSLTPEPQAILKLSKGELPPRPTGTLILERGCDDYVWQLMVECWAYDPDKRPTMDYVMKQLRGLLE
ncbi:hypothetical protein K439DRAFT_1390922 [Ramaria rubella]|nr:hypothetical protein K439DRAFT_1390922 [Ramaria rubella]